MQEEVTQKTVTFCIRTTKVTADLLKKVLAAYLRHQKQKSVEKKAKKNQPKQGKVTVKELAKQNAAFREFSQKQIQKANKPSIHKRLATYRAMMPKKSKDKVKNRHQEQSR